MKKRLVAIFTIIVLLVCFSYYENNFIVESIYKIKINRLPNEFIGFKILQISDLHNKEFGDKQDVLLRKVKKINPDIIVITGDFIDARKYNENISFELIKGLNGAYPIYFVTGNHEISLKRYSKFLKKLKNLGIIVLENSNCAIKRENKKLYLLGIDDPLNCPYEIGELNGTRQEIEKAQEHLKPTDIKILLSHRPEYFNIYSSFNIDLVLSGHAHGGQIRIPFVGGLYAPNQGFFPKYDAGLYTSGSSKMIVSRGLGNSGMPQRIFNRPELVTIELTK